jgi:hypothetical protein
VQDEDSPRGWHRQLKGDISKNADSLPWKYLRREAVEISVIKACTCFCLALSFLALSCLIVAHLLCPEFTTDNAENRRNWSRS